MAVATGSGEGVFMHSQSPQSVSVRPAPAAAAHEGIEIRPLAGDDRQRLADAFARLGEQTRRRRFGGAAERLAARDLDRLTAIDHHRHEALAAIAPATGRIVGVARYIALPGTPQRAEVAIAVDDAWQGRGIGRRLLATLVARAREEGVTSFVADVATENRPVLAWIARMGGVAVAHDRDGVRYTIRLEPPGDARAAA